MVSHVLPTTQSNKESTRVYHELPLCPSRGASVLTHPVRLRTDDVDDLSPSGVVKRDPGETRSLARHVVLTRTWHRASDGDSFWFLLSGERPDLTRGTPSLKHRRHRLASTGHVWSYMKLPLSASMYSFAPSSSRIPSRRGDVAVVARRASLRGVARQNRHLSRTSRTPSLAQGSRRSRRSCSKEKMLRCHRVIFNGPRGSPGSG